MKLCLWWLVAWVLGVTGHAAEISCRRCHEKETGLFAGSTHAQAGLSCVDCHGGNPNDTEPTAHGTDNFRRPDKKQAIAELCASCHRDVRKMNPFGLPTDQLERYKTSKHGEQLYRHDDQRVAVCTDCHGAHDVLKSKSPQARTYPANIPATCGRCHGDKELMARYKLPADVVEKYRSSHHGHLVLEKGDFSAPTCVTCHGNHGAVPPGTREVGQVCGKCHSRQAELFQKSPHAEAAAAGAFSECVSCHGNHAIQRASLDLFTHACTQCHAKDAQPLAVRDGVMKLLRQAKADYERAGEEVRLATLRGLATDDEQLLLQEAKTQVTQLEALQHTLSAGELSPVADRAGQIAGAVRAGVKQLYQVEQWKRRSLWPVWIFLMVMATLFWLKRRQIERRPR